jgi:hypothetical protein
MSSACAAGRGGGRASQLGLGGTEVPRHQRVRRVALAAQQSLAPQVRHAGGTGPAGRRGRQEEALAQQAGKQLAVDGRAIPHEERGLPDEIAQRLGRERPVLDDPAQASASSEGTPTTGSPAA